MVLLTYALVARVFAWFTNIPWCWDCYMRNGGGYVLLSGVESVQGFEYWDVSVQASFICRLSFIIRQIWHFSKLFIWFPNFPLFIMSTAKVMTPYVSEYTCRQLVTMEKVGRATGIVVRRKTNLLSCPFNCRICNLYSLFLTQELDFCGKCWKIINQTMICLLTNTRGILFFLCFVLYIDLSTQSNNGAETALHLPPHTVYFLKSNCLQVRACENVWFESPQT
jgi:hypothetical protein